MDNKFSKRKGLTKKEKLFSLYYVNTLNLELSAEKAGYKNPTIQGQKLLCREDVVEYIKELLGVYKDLYQNLALSGYQRLAFSSAADAVSLLYMDSPDKQTLQNLDLYMVSEIKKPRDGAMEIKFFDRIKALEKLYQMQSGDESNNMGLLSALSLGAQNLQEADDECGI